jgi:hypothetical protein
MREGVPSAQTPDEARLFDSEVVAEQPAEEPELEIVEPEPKVEVKPKPEPKVEAKPAEPPKKDESAERIQYLLGQIEGKDRQLQDMARERAEQYKQYQQGELDRYDLAIQGQKEAEEAADHAYEKAEQDGDLAAKRDAGKKAAVAAMRRENLEFEKERFQTNLKQEEERAKNQPPPQQQRLQYAMGSDEEINSWQIPGIAKDWAKNHRELMSTEHNRAKVFRAVQYLEQQYGLRLDNPETYRRMDSEFGFTASEPSPPPPESRRTSIVSAPVSRETPATRQQNERVELTADQVEAARISGVTPAEYARQVLKLRQLEANGQYKRNTQ